MSEPAKPPCSGKMPRAALGYGARGWAVFPLAPRSKLPLISKKAGGHGFKDATTDDAQIRAWWKKEPAANIGHVPSSAGNVVLDIDGPDAEATALAAGVPAADLGPEPRTLVCRTGRPEGGRHLYYRVPPGTVITATTLGPGTTVRYQDGYVVVPPSVHPSGQRYRWASKREPAPCPPTLLARLTGTKPPPAEPSLSGTIPEGERNDTLTRIAGRLLHDKHSEADTLALVRGVNATLCRPRPLPDAEVRALVASVGAAERAKATAAAAPFPTLRVMEGDAPEPPAVLVEDLLVDRDINELGGHGGAGKSVLALVIGVGIALGRPVFGTRAVRRAGPVLIVPPEDGQAAVRMMLDAMAEGLVLSTAERATLAARLFIVPDEEAVNLCTDTERLRDTARACGAVLVILDPLRNLLGDAAENDNPVAYAVLTALRRDVCREAGAAVLLNHHYRKPGKDQGADAEDSMHSLSGGGAWVAGARLVFGVAKKGSHITLTALKANRLRTGLCHELELTIEADPAMATRWLRCTVADRNAGGARVAGELSLSLSANERAALAILDDAQEPGLRLSWSAWYTRSGLKENTFDDIRKRLIRADLVDAVDTGKLSPKGAPVYVYRVTDQGRARLAESEGM